MKKQVKMIRPDIKGRVTLGALAQGVSRFAVTVKKDHTIVLKPYVEIPAGEQWLFRNPAALKQVKQGLKEAGEGKLAYKGSFARHIDKNDQA